MKLRYLHLSDFHLSGDDSNDPLSTVASFNQDVVLCKMLQTIKEIVEKGNPLDFVIITGDLARHGKLEQYEAVLEFCKDLLICTGVAQERLYIVPGNHDIDRKEVRSSHIKRWYNFSNQDDISELLVDPDLFPILMRKFANFNSFAKKAMGRELYDESTYHMVESISIEKQGREFNVNLMGLNSCLFAGYNGDDEKKLALGLYQVERAIKQLNKNRVLSIAFFHHPFSCFHDEDRVNQNRLMKEMDLILTGHFHQARNEFIHSGAGKAVIIGSGASFETRESENCFNLVEIDLTSGKGRVQFYKYLSDDNVWKENTDVNTNEKDGHFPITIESISQNPLTPQSHTPIVVEQTIPKKPCDIFICYSQSNSEWLQKELIPVLSKYERTDGKGLRIFCHNISNHISAVENWNRTIAAHINNCNYFLPVFTPEFFENELCVLELDWALSRDPRQKNGIVVPLQCLQTEIPFEYKSLTLIDTSAAEFSRFLTAALNIQIASTPSPGTKILEYSPWESETGVQRTRIHFIHDYSLPLTFTGRMLEKSRLIRLLQGQKDLVTNKAASLITVRASGGMGKSCLIRKLVENFHGQGRFQDIIWFSFYMASREDSSYFFLKLLETLNPDESHPVRKDIIGFSELQHMREVLCRYLDRNPILLVLDGLEIIQHMEEEKDDPEFGKIKVIHGEVEKFLIHICNQSSSAALVTSRATLTGFSGVSGYIEIPLELFSEDAGIKFLERLEVTGTREDLADCTKILGGHPLCLKSAGKYMEMKNIPANQLERITGNPELFQSSHEGLRINKIIHTYRADLSEPQEHFLKMLGLHPRSVSEKHFSALIPDYNKYNHDMDWIMAHVISPLLEKELIESLKDGDGNISYSAHPLIKLAFFNWLSPGEVDLGHEKWAKLAESSADLQGDLSLDKNAKVLQTCLDTIDHYFKSKKIDLAWNLFRGKNIDYKLSQAGYKNLSEDLRKKFQQAAAKGIWEPKHDSKWLKVEDEPNIDKPVEEPPEEIKDQADSPGEIEEQPKVSAKNPAYDEIKKNLNELFDKKVQDVPIPFSAFLEVTAKKPLIVMRNIFQVFHDMVMSYIEEGLEEYPADPEMQDFVFYDSYRLFVEDTDHPFFADRLFTNRFVNLVKTLSQGVQQNNVYLFQGPPGSGKSTFLNNLLLKFQAYANREEGMRFETVWRLDRKVSKEFIKNEFIPIVDNKTSSIQESDKYIEIPCPSHDNPILLIPKPNRRDFFDNLFKNSKFKYRLFTEKEYEWVFNDIPCPICYSLYNTLLEKLKDPTRVAEMIYARKYVVNRRLGEGISVYNPGDMTSQQNSFTNKMLQQQLDYFFKDSDRVRYIYSNFTRTNNGIYALMDIRDNNTDRLKKLCNLISEKVHKIEHIEENVNSLFLAITKPEDAKSFHPYRERIEIIKISYILDIRTEAEIYKRGFGYRIQENFLPKVLHNFARVIVSSRLNKRSEALLEWIRDPDQYKLYCDRNLHLLKMDIYSGNLPGWLTENDLNRFTRSLRVKIITESETEGQKGFSGLDSIKLFNEFYNTYADQEKLINMSNLLTFFKKVVKETPGWIPDQFLDSLVNLYDYNVLQEVKESLYHFNEQKISTEILNYLYAINFTLDSEVTCIYTGRTFNVDEEFFTHIEKKLLGEKADRRTRLFFRSDIQKEYTSRTLTQEILLEGRNIKDTDLYHNLLERYSATLKQTVLEPYFKNKDFWAAIKDYETHSFRNYYDKVREDVTYLITNMVKIHKYTEKGAKEVCLYVWNNKLDLKFSHINDV